MTQEMIIFAHLLNDYSGSPKILRLVINSLKGEFKCQKDLLLFVGAGSEGILSEADVSVVRYWYKRSGSRWLTLVSYVVSQAVLFYKLLTRRNTPRNAIVYVNTLLPFGAALYGWLTRRPVIYHIHEVSVTPALLRWFLVLIVRLTSKANIYVSRAHSKELPIRGVPYRVVYNALDGATVSRAGDFTYEPRRNGKFNVLMVSSLRDYKGVPELVQLCMRLSARVDIEFHLLANGDSAEIARYFDGRTLPSNLTVHAQAKDPSPFYEKASVLLNLSRPDLCVETFGMTVLEAMTYGVPAIVPPVGGPSELVRHGVEGFAVDSRNSERLTSLLLKLADDAALCMAMSEACRVRAQSFSEKVFAAGVSSVVREVSGQ